MRPRNLEHGSPRRALHLGSACTLCILVFPLAAQEIRPTQQKTPKKGIATRYPGDLGIKKDARVLLHADFESKDWAKHFSEIKGRGKQTVIDVEASHAHGGDRALRITATRGKDTGGHLYRSLGRGHDRIHLRFYVKFEKAHGYVHHFVHLCGYHPPTRWPQGGAGSRPRGDKRFSTGIEPMGNWGRVEPPGAWGFYSYWCEMIALRWSGCPAYWPSKPRASARK